MAQQKPLFYPSADLIAGLSHFAWGYMLVDIFAAFGHFVLGLLLTLAFAGVKEFIIDKYVELQPFKNNLVDFVEYGGGIILATVIQHIVR